MYWLVAPLAKMDIEAPIKSSLYLAHQQNWDLVPEAIVGPAPLTHPPPQKKVEMFSDTPGTWGCGAWLSCRFNVNHILINSLIILSCVVMGEPSGCSATVISRWW